MLGGLARGWLGTVSDPEAIRAVAADLRHIAGLLAGLPSPTVDGWRSRAATDVRDRLVAATELADHRADDLRGCAAALDRAADDLEADQHLALSFPIRPWMGMP